jgi:hypothetical protein
VASRTTAARGSDEYLGTYAKAFSAILKGLSKKEEREAEQLVEEWNKKGVPIELQVK